MKNTRSIRRAFKRLSRKEARFRRDVNHVVSRGIIDFAKRTGNPTIALEQLDGIRADTKKRLRKEQRSAVNSWAFYQLEQFLQYKAEDLDFEIIAVDAKYTSQGCSKCGHTEKANRHGHKFICKACGYQLQADLNAARNIKLRGVITRQVLRGDALPSVSA